MHSLTFYLFIIQVGQYNVGALQSVDFIRPTRQSWGLQDKECLGSPLINDRNPIVFAGFSRVPSLAPVIDDGLQLKLFSRGRTDFDGRD